jgi:hypothetical protein
MLGTRKKIFTAALVLGLVAIAGSAFARYPVLGRESATWNVYDSNGNVIGGGRIGCDGVSRRWGEVGPFEMTLHPCL